MAPSHVLILTDSAALGSILAASLADENIVTHFAETVRDAVGLLRLHRVKFLISDFEVAGQNVLGFVPALRRAVPYRDFETITLTRAIDNDVQNICRSVGIDEVIVKPMSPRFLRERLITRAGQLAKRDLPFDLGENVVPLFGAQASNPDFDAVH